MVGDKINLGILHGFYVSIIFVGLGKMLQKLIKEIS